MSQLKNVLKADNPSWLRSMILVALVITGIVLTIRNWDSAIQGLQILADVGTKWLLISIFSMAFSLYMMAEVMRLLLRAEGIKTATCRSTNTLTLAFNAWAATVPGGATFSTALQIKHMMQRGASAVLVSRFALFSGALPFLDLASLGLDSLFFVGQGGTTAILVVMTIVVLLATILLRRISQNPAFLNKAGTWCLRVFNRTRGKPTDTGIDRLEESIRQLTSVKLPVQILVLSFTWSFTNWVTEIVCLYATTQTVGVDGISATRVLLAFAAGKLTGFIQATPGSVNTVEAALTAALIVDGTTDAEAFAAVLVYRIVSFVLVAVVDWIICALGFDHRDQPEHQPVADRQ